MLAPLSRHLNPATAIAFIALFLAIAAPAVAKWIAPRNSVAGKSIKKNAVTSAKVKNRSLIGADIKNNTLTGKQIDESTLAKVPQADTVDGIDSANFATKDSFVTFNVPMNRGNGDRVLGVWGPFALKASCFANGPASFDVRAELTTTTDGGWGIFNAVQDTAFNAGEIKYLLNLAAVAPAAKVRMTGSVDAIDPTSGVAVQGTIYGYGGFPPANCRYVGVFTVEKP